MLKVDGEQLIQITINASFLFKISAQFSYYNSVVLKVEFAAIMINL
jgi:hypothetical protein